MEPVIVLHENFVNENDYDKTVLLNPYLSELGQKDKEISRAIGNLMGMMSGLSNLMACTTCEIELANLAYQKEQLSVQVSELKRKGRDLIQQFEEEQQKVIQRWNARKAQ